MILKWLRSVVETPQNEATQQGAIEESKKKKDDKLVDVAHESLAAKAAEQCADLEGLVKYGWPRVKREKFKGTVRKKVWDMVHTNFNAEDDGIVEEVTERIVDAAEIDPYYQKIFEEKNQG